jgi:hypothetical protein
VTEFGDWRCGLLALLAFGNLVAPIAAQPGPRNSIRLEQVDQLGPITVVPVPRDVFNALRDAEQELAERRYPEAVALLRTLLDVPEDYLLGPAVNGWWTSSVKQRAARLLRTLPAEGQQVYRVQCDAAAAQLWSQYEETRDPAAALEIIRRFPATTASTSAMSALAATAFDRSQPLMAARWWDDLAAEDASSPHGLERIAAWSAAGLTDRARTLLAEQSQRPQPAWRVMGTPVPAARVNEAILQWLAARFPDNVIKPPLPLTDWTTFRGDAMRTGIARPAGPIGDPLWSRNGLEITPTWADRFRDPSSTKSTEWADAVDTVEERLGMTDRVSLPGLHPLVIGSMAVFRTADVLTAVDLPTGEVRWRSPMPFSQLFPKSRLTAAAAMEDRERLLQLLHQRLFRDRTTGLLSSDGECVYAVEASPIHDNVDPFRGGLPVSPTVVNKLTAYDLRTGRIRWELGGRRTEAGGPFDGFFFQGPPLVVGDRLYCIAEINTEQRLLQLRPSRDAVTLEWSQVIAAPLNALGWGLQRRFGGQTPSLAGDVLVCPTSAGLVVGVDPVRQRILWGYRYASHNIPSPGNQFAMFGGFQNVDPRPVLDEDDGYWQDAAPAIAKTHVVLTPRDSMELHVVDLLTGELLWKQPRDERLYVAGIDGHRLLIVGRRVIESRNLADGALIWEQPIPTPTGRGLTQPGRYLLPVDGNELWAIDTATGRVTARAKSAGGRGFGNLAVGAGGFVSQTVREVTAYRALDDIERQIAAALIADSNDADALGLRGELRLFQGDEAGGVTDLRKALAVRPDRQTGRILAGVLIDGLKRDFGHYQSLIDEIDRVTVDPELRAEFLELVADGLERQGNRVAAFGQYLKLMALASTLSEVRRVDSALMARMDRLIRGRALSTYQTANSTERAQIDQLLRQTLEQSMADNDPLERDRRFLQFFEGHPLTDPVRRRLAERLPAERLPERIAHLRRLADSRTPTSAAYGAARLARWHLDRNEFSAVRPWLVLLNTEYRGVSLGPDEAVGPLLDRWATEFVNRWNLSPPAWPTGPIEPERRPAIEPTPRRIARMEFGGPVSREYRDWSFELHDEGLISVVARDPAGRQQWAVTLPDELAVQIPRGTAPLAAPRCFTAGTTLAISLSTAFVVLDVSVDTRTPKVLWHRSLAPTEGGPAAGLLMILTETTNSGRRRTYVGDRKRE